MMNNELNHMLNQLRMRRKFVNEECIQAKITLLNDYMLKSSLKACVVGVSGGIDSALTIAILDKASQQKNSPIQKIISVLMPVFKTDGARNQEVALARGQLAANKFNTQCVIADLSSSHANLKYTIDHALQLNGDAWASGQLVSYLRTPSLYYITSLLFQQNLPAIVCGTTNRDEGGYIGYFGKAADGMVDLQLISDLHKSEVVSLSRYLHVPEEIIMAEPTGDIYDGRNDEQLIGVPYDFIELYTLYLTLVSKREREDLYRFLGDESRHQFECWKDRLDILNRECAHKYMGGGSQSIHLDVYERAVPGGWEASCDQSPVVDHSVFINEFHFHPQIINQLGDKKVTDISQENIASVESASLLHGLLTPSECTQLLGELNKQEWVPVGMNGYLKDYRPGKDIIGSYRASAYNEVLADIIWQRLIPAIPLIRIMYDNTPTDWDECRVWRAMGINPLMRFISYVNGGLLVPHYDAPYVYHNRKRTLMSLVIYLTDHQENVGGSTRFIIDPQMSLPLADRQYQDWTVAACEHQVLASIAPKVGSGILFDHRMLHDSEMLNHHEKKMILRTDLIFEKCGVLDQRKITVSKPLGLAS